MRGLDDGPDGLNDKAFDRALGMNATRKTARHTFPTSRLTEGELSAGWSLCADPDCKPTLGGRSISGPHAHRTISKAVR